MDLSTDLAALGQTDQDALIRMTAAEAGNEPPAAQQAVASTALNRANLTGEPVAQIASDPATYNGVGTSRFHISPNDPAYQAVAANLAPVIQNGPTTQATHFYSPALMSTPPDWARGLPGQKIGSQLFYSRPQDFQPSQESQTNDQADFANYLSGRGVRAVTPVPGGGVTDPATGEKYAPDSAHPGQYLNASGQSYEIDNPAQDLADFQKLRGQQGATAGPPSSPQSTDLLAQAGGGVSDLVNGALTSLRNAPQTFANALGVIGSGENAAFTGNPDALEGYKEAVGNQRALNAQPGVQALPSVAAPQGALPTIVREGTPFLLGAFAGPEGEGSALANLAVRARNVIAPFAGSQLGQRGAQAIGYGPEGQQIAGALGAAGGGALAGAPALYSGGKGPAAFGIESETAPVTATIASRAADYAKGLTANPDPNMVAAQQAGLQPTVADIAGPRGVIAARAAAGKSPEVAQAAQTLAQERAAALPDDYANAFHQATGIDPNAAKGDFDAAIAERRTNLAPHYQQAFASPEPVTSPALVDLMKRPPIQQAMKMAADQLQTEGKYDAAASLTGQAGATSQGLAFKSGEPVPAAVAKQLGLVGGGSSMPAPTLEAWDGVKRAVQQLANYQDAVEKGLQPMQPGFTTASSQAVRGVASQLTDALREASPAYGGILDQAGDYMKQRAAFERGSADIFSPKVSPQLQQSYLDGLSDPEREAYQGGIANAVSQKIGTGQMTPGKLNIPYVKAKMANAMGDSAQDFSDSVGQIAKLKANAQAMVPTTGSATQPTAEAAAEQAALGGQGNLLSRFGQNALHGIALGEAFHGGLPISSAIGAALHYGAARTAADLMIPRLRNAIAGFGMSPDAQAEAGRLLLSRMTPEELAAYADNLRLAPERGSALQGYALGRLGNAYVGALPTAGGASNAP